MYCVMCIQYILYNSHRILKLPLIIKIKNKYVDCKLECLMHKGYQLIVVVYQCTNSNLMVPLGIFQHIQQGSHCVRMLETHPLLHGTYPIITSPCMAWIVASLHKLWHSTYKYLYYPVISMRIDSVLGVYDYRRGLERSISGCVCQCFTTKLHL